jgi:2OG-Fe(II) oxygenase superfamily
MSVRYCVSSQCSFRAMGNGLVEASPLGYAQCVLSLEEWHLLSQLTTPRTVEEVCGDSETSALTRELRDVLDVWCTRAVLCRSDDANDSSSDDVSISSMLSAELVGDPALLKEVSAGLCAGRLVVLPDAFKPEFAAEVWSALDSCRRWLPFEVAGGRPGFHFSHHNIAEPAPEAFRRCVSLFDSHATKQLIRQISGRPVEGTAVVTASWYQAGDFSLPHTDGQVGRQVAFVWHLTKDWDDTWGGQLAWCPNGASVYPRYNSLSLFNVSNTSLHFVAAVSRRATGKRLAVNGWWRDLPKQEARESPMQDQAVGHVTARYGAPIRSIAGRVIVV